MKTTNDWTPSAQELEDANVFIDKLTVCILDTPGTTPMDHATLVARKLAEIRRDVAVQIRDQIEADMEPDEPGDVFVALRAARLGICGWIDGDIIDALPPVEDKS